MLNDTVIRRAIIEDLPDIRRFTDFWLSGRGKRVGAEGAVNDCFISPSQHKKYILKYETNVLFQEGILIGWAVIQTDGSLIHLLIAGDCRRKGFGKMLFDAVSPEKIHSKSNQSSGDPAGFYEHLGFTKTKTVKSKSRLDIDRIKPNRKPIIDIYERIQCSG